MTEQDSAQRARQVIERGARARWWRRRGSKRGGFWYVDAQGARITDEAQLERIRQLAIPPAWKHVRISPSRHSPLQAVGVDTCQRVQYRYREEFAARRQQAKYAKIERFGERLPALREMANAHIGLDGLPKEKTLAVVLRLINDLYFRVGSEESVSRYRTYGITTLRNRHLEILPDGSLLFRFVGKHHIQHRRLLVDAELAAVMREIKALRGSRLFQYLDENGRPHPVTPQDVNRYIKAAAGPEFSAKDFRTWGGTLLAAVTLAERGKPEDEKQAKNNILQAIRQVAERLGNTPTVCRNCYIHPVVFERYRQGITLEDFRRKAERAIRRCQPAYEPEELALLKLFHAETPETADLNQPGE
ncbi:MAG TPA: hypothetical protein VFB21_07455 [Chthonomonadaceae bacterium]|nr:hypothetical protein [Chthonomonadaceae bacterium]